MKFETDVLIIGCGIAGAAAALRLSEDPNRRILLITRESDPHESATLYAQGGLVAGGGRDTRDRLLEDIVRAGAGLSDPKAAAQLCDRGPQCVQELLIEELHVPFSWDEVQDTEWASHNEGPAVRTLHVRDATGRAIEERMIKALRQRPNVEWRVGWTAVDLITSPYHDSNPLAVYDPVVCHGAYVLDRGTEEVHCVLAPATILATGGLGQIFRHSSNPSGARGDGLAMAYRAGARIENVEFVQFHPTTMALSGVGNFLISEAVRGAGARLLNPRKEPFMKNYSLRWGDLAARDVVARVMHHEMLNHGYPHLLLDLRPALDAQQIEESFPTIQRACAYAGIDITREPIPVVPAAHFSCGGVLVDELGRSTIDGLYAVGEVCCSGVHGANRLASTSLLEGLVWGSAAGADISTRADLVEPDARRFHEWAQTGRRIADPVLVQREIESVQNVMWHYVGLSRSEDRLSRAVNDLNHMWIETDALYQSQRLDDALLGLRNRVQCGLIVARAARRNRTSRGVHWREDAESVA